MLFVFRSDHASCALLAVVAVMTDPRFAENLPAKTAVPLLGVPGISSVGRVRLQGECMRGRPQADDGPAGLHVFDNVLHLLIRQLSKAREDGHQIGGPQCFQAGNIVSLVGIDRAVFGIDGEEDRALESMMGRQDLGQLRQRFLGAVFLVAADEDHVLALSRSFPAVQDNPRIVGLRKVADQDCEIKGQQIGKSWLMHVLLPFSLNNALALDHITRHGKPSKVRGEKRAPKTQEQPAQYRNARFCLGTEGCRRKVDSKTLLWK